MYSRIDFLPLHILLGIVALSTIVMGIAVGLGVRQLSQVFFLIILVLVLLRIRYLHVPQIWPILGFLSVLVIGTLDLAMPFLPQLPDATFYHDLATRTAAAINRDSLPLVDFRNLRVASYAFPLGVVYLATGPVRWIPIAINAGLWGLTIGTALQLGKEVLNLDRSRLNVAGMLMLVSPAGILFNSAILRDTFSILIAVHLVLHGFRWLEWRRWQDGIWIASFTVLAGIVRPEIVPAFAGAFFVSLSFRTWSGSDHRRLFRVGIGSGVLLAGAWLVNAATAFAFDPVEVTFLEVKRRALATHTHAYLVDATYESWLDVFALLPMRLFNLIVQPFPWIPSNYGLTIATLDAIFFGTLLTFGAIGLARSNVHRRRTLLLALFVVFVLVGYSLVVSTKTAAPRRRLIVMPIVAILSCRALPGFKIKGPVLW